MNTFKKIRDRFFPTPQQLPSGFHPYQSPPEVNPPYRLHLRLENDGTGVLVINAKTVLHLNQTAAEMAFHMVRNEPVDAMAKAIAKRYNVPRELALRDCQEFLDRLQTIIETPTLDPVTFLDFDRVDPYSQKLSAPYRLDCALTYKTGGEDAKAAPVDRVKRELLTDEWKVILQKAWQAGIPQIVFTGGEPTLRPDLCDLIAITQNQGQVTGLLTDGKRLAERDYLHALLQSGLDHVMINLDPESTQTWEAIKDVANEDLFMTVHITLNERIKHDAAAILEKLDNKMGKNRSLSLSANDPSLSKELAEFRNLAVTKGFEISWDLPVPYSTLNPVSLEMDPDFEPIRGAGNAWLYVEPDGDVLPGQGINKVIGNMLTDDWEKIWKNRE
jgi:MoaA/NifB/PqqE/SkfB family radical SAM enzyme